MKRLASVILLVLAGAAAAAPPAAPEVNVLRRSREMMGTVCEIVVAIPRGDDEGAVDEAIEAAFAEMIRVEHVMTTWLPESTVSKINAAAGKAAVAVDPETQLVIEKSLWGAKLSNGAFDITVGTFKGLWKFDHDIDGSIPADSDVKARLPHVGWKKVKVTRGSKKSPAKIKLTDPKTLITLGGSAKGYAVDRAVFVLRERGFHNFIVQAGGDLYAAGDRGDRAWTVGIKDPRGTEPFASIQLKDSTFSTSGDYERFIDRDGKRYHHILDPKTGYPVFHTRSCTVMAKDGLTSDVVDTMLFVLGPEKGLEVARKVGVEAVWVTADNRVVMTPGMQARLKMLRKPTP